MNHKANRSKVAKNLMILAAMAMAGSSILLGDPVWAQETGSLLLGMDDVVIGCVDMTPTGL